MNPNPHTALDSNSIMSGSQLVWFLLIEIIDHNAPQVDQRALYNFIQLLFVIVVMVHTSLTSLSPVTTCNAANM